MYTDPVWGAVVDAATRVVQGAATPRDCAWWHGLGESECVAHVVSAKCVMDVATERAVRSVCVPLLLSLFEDALRGLENEEFYSEICDMVA